MLKSPLTAGLRDPNKGTVAQKSNLIPNPGFLKEKIPEPIKPKSKPMSRQASIGNALKFINYTIESPMKKIAAGTYWDLELGYDLSKEIEIEKEENSAEYDLEAREVQQRLGGHLYHVDDEGNIQCVEHKDHCESGIGSGKHIKINHPPSSESDSQNSSEDEKYIKEYVEESDLPEEKNNPSKYPMHLSENTESIEEQALSPVWEQSQSYSQDEGTGHWRRSRRQTMGTHVIVEEMSSCEDSSEAQEEDPSPHQESQEEDSRPRGSSIKLDFGMENPFFMDRNNNGNSEITPRSKIGDCNNNDKTDITSSLKKSNDPQNYSDTMVSPRDACPQVFGGVRPMKNGKDIVKSRYSVVINQPVKSQESFKKLIKNGEQIQEAEKIKPASVIPTTNSQTVLEDQPLNLCQSMAHLESLVSVSTSILEPKDVLPVIEEIISGEELDCDERISNTKQSFVPRSLTRKRV
jgi:hypothetical protein